MLNQRVTTYNADGGIIPDDGVYQQRGAEIVFVFAEFMNAKGLLKADVDVGRRPDLELQFSQLTENGQRFARFALDKWMRSLDKVGSAKAVDAKGLERFWAKFSTSMAQ